MSEKILTGTYCMPGFRNFCQVGGWGGGPCLTARKQLWQRFFSPQLILQFYSGLSMVYFKENYNFPRFQRGQTFFRGGGQTFSRGGGGWSNFFQGSLNANLYRTYDFPGGPDPLSPPLWIRTCTGISSKTNEHPSTCLHFKNKAKSSCMITIFIERQRYTFMNLN